MTLGLLFIAFIVFSVISVLGILLLFLTKDERKKKGIFYFLAVWGMLIAVFSATSQPSNYIVAQLIAWAFGFLSIAGLVVHYKAKVKARCYAAYLLVSASSILGVLHLFVL